MSNSAYYGILLVPLFAVGLAFLPMTVKSQKLLRFVGIPIMILVTASNFALPQQNQARTIGQYFEKANYGSVWHKTKPIARALVVGPFGHEYQYYLPFEIVKYSDVLQDMSQEIIICNEKCPSVLIEGKKLLLKEPVEVYSL